MAIREMRLEGDPILRKKSRLVPEINKKIITLLDDMKETMDSENGVGLAAPQVGILKRVVLVNIDDNLYEMINPQIIETKGEQCKKEGCLSLPGQTGYVLRPAYVKVKYLDRNGEEQILEAEEMVAVCVCHELDHLEGILFIDNVVEVDEDELEEDEYDEA